MTSSRWYLEVKLSQFNPFDRSRWKIWIAKQQTSNMFAKNDWTQVMQCTLQLARSAAEMEPHQLFSGTKLAMTGRSFRINNSWLCSLRNHTTRMWTLRCSPRLGDNQQWSLEFSHCVRYDKSCHNHHQSLSASFAIPVYPVQGSKYQPMWTSIGNCWGKNVYLMVRHARSKTIANIVKISSDIFHFFLEHSFHPLLFHLFPFSSSVWASPTTFFTKSQDLTEFLCGKTQKPNQ